MATVTATDEAQSQFDDLPVRIQVRILRVYDRLAKWPAVSGVKSLRGNLAGKHRIRTGDYRVQFHISDDVVVVEKVGHRDGFYEE